jgi:hypothetical protein
MNTATTVRIMMNTQHWERSVEEYFSWRDNPYVFVEPVRALNWNSSTVDPSSYTYSPEQEQWFEQNAIIQKEINHLPNHVFPDLSAAFYFDDGTDVEYKKTYKQHYLKYLREMFTLCFGPHHGYRVEDVFDVEVKMLYAMGCESGIKEDPNGYNKVFTKDAVSQYQFDWSEFASGLGFKETPEFFVTSSLNYLKCGTELLLKEWTSEPWRTYLIYIYIRQLIRFNYEGHDISYQFRGKFERGMGESSIKYTKNEILNQDNIYPVFGLGFAFNTFLTNEYYDRYENKQYIDYVRK